MTTDAPRLGEVGFLTRDVRRLAGFYRWLLCLPGESGDEFHQELLGGDVALTVTCAEDGPEPGRGGLCLAFTVADVDAEHERLLARGVTVLDPPATRPWGARNMRFLDPDGNIVYMRQFPTK